MYCIKGRVEGIKEVEIGKGDKKTKKIVLQLRSRPDGAAFSKDYFVDCFGYSSSDFKVGSEAMFEGLQMRVNKSKETGQVFLNVAMYKPKGGK